MTAIMALATGESTSLWIDYEKQVTINTGLQIAKQLDSREDVDRVIVM